MVAISNGKKPFSYKNDRNKKLGPFNIMKTKKKTDWLNNEKSFNLSKKKDKIQLD